MRIVSPSGKEHEGETRLPRVPLQGEEATKLVVVRKETEGGKG